MEHPKYHEIVQPVKEIVHQIGNWVVNKVLPTEIFDNFIQGVSQESAERTTQMFTQDRLFEE